MDNVKTCCRCKQPKPLDSFHRRRKTGAGNWRGENARRGICIACDKATRKPQVWVPRPKRPKPPSKWGFREALIAKGMKPGSKEYKSEYHKLYIWRVKHGQEQSRNQVCKQVHPRVEETWVQN